MTKNKNRKVIQSNQQLTQEQMDTFQKVLSIQGDSPDGMIAVPVTIRLRAQTLILAYLQAMEETMSLGAVISDHLEYGEQDLWTVLCNR